MKNLIYCVEDDNGIRDLILYALKTSGIEARGFADGGSFWKAMKTELPELIMLDIMLPGDDGITVLKKLRADPLTAELPVIMATAKGTEYDKVVGLDLGADDYLAKPFGMIEMIARVKAILRRAARKTGTARIKNGGIEMNKAEHTVSAAGERAELTLKEYALLETFMDNPGRVFTRDQLLNLIWGNDYIGETRTVDVHIGTLRTKLGSCGNYIETVRGVGYRMKTQK